MTNATARLLASYNDHYTFAIMFFIVGAGMLALSRAAADDWSRVTRINAAQAESPGAPRPSFWNWKPKDIPAGRLRFVLRAFAVVVLAVATWELAAGLLAS